MSNVEGRRNFLKTLGLGLGAVAAVPLVKGAEAAEKATTVMPDPTVIPPGSSFQRMHDAGRDNPCLEFPSRTCEGSGAIPGLQHTLDVADDYAYSAADMYENKMGLRANRTVLRSDISFFMDETAIKGSVVSIDPDSSQPIVRVQQYNEQPFGILMNDVVELDLTRQNCFGPETQKGGKVEIMTCGEIVTRPVGEPYPGDMACAHNGYISSNNPQGVRIGTFLTGKDEDGFAKVSISHI